MPDPAPPADLTGRTIGDYQVVRKLGQGGMGTVYLARQLSLKRDVALKILRDDLTANAAASQRFQNEAEAVARVTHANIVQVYAVGEHDGLRYMALEYVEGRNLKEYMARKGPPDLPLALHLLRQVAAALQRAGEAGLVHRDVKPENILVTRKGAVKVADFGLARAFAGDAPAVNLTQSGMTLGTPLYMAPEQVQGKPTDHRTDLYSFGVTAYHLLAGHPPFNGTTPFEVAVQHVQNEPPPLAEVRPDLPADLCGLVHKLMAKDPAARYPTARDVLRDLARIQKGVTVGLPAGGVSLTGLTLQTPAGQPTAINSATTEALPVPTSSAAGRWRWAAVVVGAVGLAALGWWAGGRLGGPTVATHAGPGLPDARLPEPLTSARERELRARHNDRKLSAADYLTASLELALLYLGEHRLDDADLVFTELEKDAGARPVGPKAKLPGNPTVLAGKLGRAAVLAHRDQAAQSVELFIKAVDPPTQRGLLENLLIGHPDFAQAVGDALTRDAENLVLKSLPAKLEWPPPPGGRPRGPAGGGLPPLAAAGWGLGGGVKPATRSRTAEVADCNPTPRPPPRSGEGEQVGWSRRDSLPTAGRWRLARLPSFPRPSVADKVGTPHPLARVPHDMLTPMMQQFRDAKAQHPGMLVLFRNGDFYELFEEDADLGSRLLGITLTKRDGTTPMAGFPQHKLEHYLNLLLRAGHRVAVCEQMEESWPGKKIIRREVNRVVTPGTVTEDELLDPRRSNYLAALCRAKTGTLGLAWIDLSTGAFAATDLLDDRLSDELARLSAAECLLADDQLDALRPLLGPTAPTVTARPGWTFDPTTAVGAVKKHFGIGTLTGFGFADDQPCLAAAGAVLSYLTETLKASLAHIRRLRPHRPDACLTLDEVTRRSLELTRTLRDGTREGTVLAAIDRTVTPMGARFLHDALLAPLTEKPAIDARLDAVGELVGNHALRGELRDLLDATTDLQRLTARVSTARATPKDLAAVARTLRLLPKFKAKLAGRSAPLLAELEGKLELCPDLRDLLDRALVDDPPYSAKEGGILREGYHAELDELRKLSKEGKDWIARYQAAEITRTGITSLKVGFTDVMGYYIEITNANETRVPPEYVHERTLKNCKRYSTPRLKEYEEKVVTAKERSQALEFELFATLRETVAAQTHRLLQTADVLATTDFLAGLAELAASRGYVRPTVVEEPVLRVQDGRHPVLDQILPAGTFVPNDVLFAPADGVFWLITGPNMSGKSTFIRQVALLTLLAHVGSFVPAKAATIGLSDRIFTRVGASDELSRGQSTFMVEMTEAANILNNATSRSLVILDEIGRGTSTYDGVSLAWAITEHLHDAVGCRALFATHYHELAQLGGRLSRLRNYNVLVKELPGEVVFLHQIAPGSADKSYGIHVARLAGVPNSVLRRAEEVLATLEAPKPVAAPSLPLPEPAKPKRPAKAAVVVDPPERPKRKEPAGPSLFAEGEPPY